MLLDVKLAREKESELRTERLGRGVPWYSPRSNGMTCERGMHRVLGSKKGCTAERLRKNAQRFVVTFLIVALSLCFFKEIDCQLVSVYERTTAVIDTYCWWMLPAATYL